MTLRTTHPTVADVGASACPNLWVDPGFNSSVPQCVCTDPSEWNQRTVNGECIACGYPAFRSEHAAFCTGASQREAAA